MTGRFRRGAAAFLRSVGILAGGAAVGQIIALAASPLLSRLYSPGSFGVFAVFTAILGICLAVASLRFEQAIGLPRSDQVGFNLLVLASLVAVFTSVVLALVVLFTPALLGIGDEMPLVVRCLLPVALVLGAMYQALSIWALRSRLYLPIARTRVMQGVATALTQIGGGLLGYGPAGLAAGHALGQFAGVGNLARSSMKTRRLRRPTLRELWAALARYRKFPLLATPAALLNAVSLQVPVLLFAGVFGPATAGQYFLSARITMAPNDLLGRSVGQVFYAEAIRVGAHRPGVLQRLVLTTSARSFLLGLIPSGAVLIFAPTLFPIVLGAEWEEAGRLSQVMAFMLLANFAVTPVAQVFLIVERQVLSVLANVAKLLAALLGMLIPIWMSLRPVEVMLVYSCVMAVYYLAVLAGIVALLGGMRTQRGAEQ